MLKIILTAAAATGMLYHAIRRQGPPTLHRPKRVTLAVERAAGKIERARLADLEEVDEEEWGEYGKVVQRVGTGPVSVKLTVAGAKPTGGSGLLAQLVTPSGRNRAARRAAAHVRAKVGLLKRTEANDLVVGRLLRDYLSEKGVRPTHVVAIEPIARTYYYMPTTEDIYARQLDASRSAVEQRARYEATYYTDIPGRGLFGWFRRMRVYTGPPPK